MSYKLQLLFNNRVHWEIFLWVWTSRRRPPSSVCPPHSLKIFSSETAGSVEAKFHMESGMGEQKFVQMVLVTWPRWLPCPYMVKTLKNLLVRHQMADNLETWYAALGARVLPSLFKWWPWVDLDLCYGKVKFGRLCSCIEKRSTNGFFRNYCRLW